MLWQIQPDGVRTLTGTAVLAAYRPGMERAWTSRTEEGVRGNMATAAVAFMAVAASLLGVSGLTGPTGTHLLLAFGAVVALNLTRAQGRD